MFFVAVVPVIAVSPWSILQELASEQTYGVEMELSFMIKVQYPLETQNTTMYHKYCIMIIVLPGIVCNSIRIPAGYSGSTWEVM